MSDEEIELDPESISFVGYRNAPPTPVELDFGDRIFSVEFYRNKDCYFKAVNAASEKAAIAVAVEQMLAERVNPYVYEWVIVNELEVIPDGNGLAGSDGGEDRGDV